MRGFKRSKVKNKNARKKAQRPPRQVRIAPPSGSSHRHASRIGEAVVNTWHRKHGAANPEIPVSVVASLSFIAPPAPQRDAAARQLLALRPHDLVAVARAQWAIFVNARPDLVNRVWPLMRVWHADPLDDDTLRAAKACADAAVRAGLLHLTAKESRREADLFGHLVMLLRPPSALTKQGQIYTPGELADFMARMSTPEEHTTVQDPCAGTGGLLRAAAQAMREQGRDPTTVTWIAVDIDELAIACLAVSVVLWDLGGKVLLGVGDSLAGDAWMNRALAERRETVELAATVRRDKTMLQLLQLTEDRVRAAADEQPQRQGPRATQHRGWQRRKT